MSDEIERATHALIRDHIGVYAVLRLTLLRLPIPISIPGPDTFELVTAMRAVSRAARIVKDLPMEKEEIAALWWSAENWVSAGDALQRYLRGETTRTTVERFTRHSAEGLKTYLSGPTKK